MIINVPGTLSHFIFITLCSSAGTSTSILKTRKWKLKKLRKLLKIIELINGRLGIGVGNIYDWKNLSKILFFCKEGTLGWGGQRLRVELARRPEFSLFVFVHVFLPHIFVLYMGTNLNINMTLNMRFVLLYRELSKLPYSCCI